MNALRLVLWHPIEKIKAVRENIADSNLEEAGTKSKRSEELFSELESRLFQFRRESKEELEKVMFNTKTELEARRQRVQSELFSEKENKASEILESKASSIEKIKAPSGLLAELIYSKVLEEGVFVRS